MPESEMPICEMPSAVPRARWNQPAISAVFGSGPSSARAERHEPAEAEVQPEQGVDAREGEEARGQERRPQEHQEASTAPVDLATDHRTAEGAHQQHCRERQADREARGIELLGQRLQQDPEGVEGRAHRQELDDEGRRDDPPAVEGSARRGFAGDQNAPASAPHVAPRSPAPMMMWLALTKQSIARRPEW
jgi:hypothetical protein